MQRKSRSIVWLLFWLISTPLIHSQDQRGPRRNKVCNQDGTICVKTALEQSVVQNPFYFEVQVRCPTQIVLGWELRDDSGKITAHATSTPEMLLALLPPIQDLGRCTS